MTATAGERPVARPTRRAVLGTATTVAAGATLLPLRGLDPVLAAAPADPAVHGRFGYGVASGDPLADRVVIWTRVTPPGRPVAAPGSGRGGPVRVEWEVAADPDFRRIVRAGQVTTTARRDHTVSVDVDGLTAYTRYWYRFRALGSVSRVGRTRTAPDDPRRTHALRFALVSCSNYAEGWFAGYRALAERDDLDFVLHVGDYIYEYGNDHAGALARQRAVRPDGETLDLTDYRLRHALYKADPDLQAAHAAHPFIAIFDDHEIANNAWRGGAANHDEDTEGDFGDRRARALRAWREWLPVRMPSPAVPHRGTRYFRRFTFGGLADLSVLETRQNRSRQVKALPWARTGGYVPADEPALTARLADPSRHLPEPEQLRWLERGTAMPRHWHLIGNQTVLAPVRFPGAAVGHPDVASMLNSDAWDGYQADQRRLLAHLAAQPSAARGDAIVLTGDVHSSWVCDLPGDPAAGAGSIPAGVEFVCPSLTSNGFYETFAGRSAPGTPVNTVLARTRSALDAITARNGGVRWLDGVGHGFVVVDVTVDRVRGDWFLTPPPTSRRPDPRLARDLRPQWAHGVEVRRGERTARPAATPLGSRSDEPAGQLNST